MSRQAAAGPYSHPMPTSRAIQRTYLTLMLGNTLAASLIWGINTIFLLDAGLSNLEAFAANASRFVRPASSRKIVLIPQISDAASVFPRIRVM